MQNISQTTANNTVAFYLLLILINININIKSKYN